MQTNLYTYVGMFSRGLDTLGHLLTTGAGFAAANGVSEGEMLEWRLTEDMHPLRFQAQTVIRFASLWPARAAGLELPRDPDWAETLPELRQALAEAKDGLTSLTADQFEGRDQVPLTVSIGPQMEPTLPTAQWVPGFAIPNFYFHLSMAYAILRARGVAVGKRDFFAGGL